VGGLPVDMDRAGLDMVFTGLQLGHCGCAEGRAPIPTVGLTACHRYHAPREDGRGH